MVACCADIDTYFVADIRNIIGSYILNEKYDRVVNEYKDLFDKTRGTYFHVDAKYRIVTNLSYLAFNFRIRLQGSQPMAEEIYHWDLREIIFDGDNTFQPLPRNYL